MPSSSIQKIFLAVALSFPLWGITPPCLADGEKTSVANRETLTVTGYAEKIARSDCATLWINLAVTDRDYKVAYQKLSDQVKEVTKFLMDMGIEEGKIYVQELDITIPYIKDIFYNRDNKEKNILKREIMIIMDSVDQAQDIYAKMSSLVEKDFVFSKQVLLYEYTKEDDLRDELTQKALINGQNKALKKAKRLGRSLGIPTIHLNALSSSPFPHKPSYAEKDRDAKNLFNTFSVRVDMTYPLNHPSEKTEQKTEETTANL